MQARDQFCQLFAGRKFLAHNELFVCNIRCYIIKKNTIYKHYESTINIYKHRNWIISAFWMGILLAEISCLPPGEKIIGTYKVTAKKGTKAGKYTITINFATSKNYNAAQKKITITVK